MELVFPLFPLYPLKNIRPYIYVKIEYSLFLRIGGKKVVGTLGTRVKNRVQTRMVDTFFLFPLDRF